MKLLKLISFIFLIYFIRRLFQMFQAMKVVQERNAELERENSKLKEAAQENTVDVDFKVL